MPVYKEEVPIPVSSLLQLYNDANWTTYTRHPEQLVQAINESLYVLSAWDNDTLVGLIRVIGDGLTIIYIQDILVLKTYKRQQIGTTLMSKVLDKYEAVRQKVLLTDDSEETRGFYESLGFSSTDKQQLIAYVKIENEW